MVKFIKYKGTTMNRFVASLLIHAQSMPPFKRKIMKMIGDGVIILSAYYLAYLTRFEWNIPSPYESLFLLTAPILVMISLICFCLCGAYSEFWVYWSYRDFKKLLFAHTLTTGLLYIVNALVNNLYVPRSIFVIYWIFSIQFLAFIRIIFRVLIITKRIHKHDTYEIKKVLIVGAGEAGELLIRSILSNKYGNYQIVGLIDDDPDKYKRRIHGVPVLGNRDQIVSTARKHNIDEIMLAIPTASLADMQAIVRLCVKTGVPYKTLPGPGELLSGQVNVNQIRDVEIGDLLGRKQGDMDDKRVSELVRNKRILVTGAAGSIGSELCRQIVQYHPSELIVIDKDENGLFYLQNELEEVKRQNFFVMPVQDRKRLKDIFYRFQPQLIFHAAAYKHVSSLEKNPEEAILNNLVSTITLADMAQEFEVEKFIQISTDKAVNPVNIMGASKRLCELYCQYLSHNGNEGYISVRFGNVIGSQGSVLTIFKKQIKFGGPVTVTHPTMTRFFMSIQEACRLVLESAALGKGGCIFVLDMGQPINIMNLAEQMIRLSGFEPNRDIPIKIIGFRPGEKMHEELWYAHEIPQKTLNPKVLKSNNNHKLEEEFLTHINTILSSARSLNTQKMYRHIKFLIPELTIPTKIVSSPDLRRGVG
ncbi:MAG: nucleoside-diphosphate sugar epimerase/dehydratase [bacterium]